MATLAVHPIPVAGGLSVTDNLAAASGGGDSAPVGPRRFLVVRNGDAAPHTVTVVTPGTVSGLAVADATVTVAAGKTSAIPLTAAFKGANGRAAITYDGVTSVTVGVFELPA